MGQFAIGKNWLENTAYSKPTLRRAEKERTADLEYVWYAQAIAASDSLVGPSLVEVTVHE